MNRRDFVSRSAVAGSALLIAGGATSSAAAAPKPGQFVHCVYFWMRPDLSTEERALFERGLQMLKAIDTVRAGFVGTSPPAERGIVDDSYDYALVLAFDDSAGHEVYQVHPDHEQFRQDTVGFWQDIKIYDTITT
ncbi:MAG: Dabb family protein [Bacteroidota bacterium]